MWSVGEKEDSRMTSDWAIIIDTGWGYDENTDSSVKARHEMLLVGVVAEQLGEWMNEWMSELYAYCQLYLNCKDMSHTTEWMNELSLISGHSTFFSLAWVSRVSHICWSLKEQLCTFSFLPCAESGMIYSSVPCLGFSFLLESPVP